jgi:hypothetical protein
MLHKDSKAPPELLSIAPSPLPDDPASSMPTESPAAEASESTPDALGGPNFRPRSSRRRALIAGAGVLLLAALAWRLLSAPGAQQAATDKTQVPPAVAAANAEPTPAPAEPSSPTREKSEPQTTKTAPAASAQNTDSTRKSRSVSSRSARRSAPAVQTRSSTRSRAPARQDDDVDVGF